MYFLFDGNNNNEQLLLVIDENVFKKNVRVVRMYKKKYVFPQQAMIGATNNRKKNM